MLITEHSRSLRGIERSLGRDQVTIDVDNVEMFRVSEGEDADNKIEKNFKDVFNIMLLLKLANGAGLKGEDIEITYRQHDWNW